MRTLLAVFAILCLFGCTLLDGANRADAGACGGADGGCNDLMLGVMVPVVRVTGYRPDAGGGAIVDGTYVLVDSTQYAGPTGIPGPTNQRYATTFQFCGGGYAAVGQDATALEAGRVAGVYSVAGTRISLQETCGGQAAGSAEYTAQSDRLILFGPDTSETFAKQ